jgi:hypothetical protein
LRLGKPASALGWYIESGENVVPQIVMIFVDICYDRCDFWGVLRGALHVRTGQEIRSL